jgi:hypothetical protein
MVTPANTVFWAHDNSYVAVDASSPIKHRNNRVVRVTTKHCFGARILLLYGGGARAWALQP